MPPPIGFGIKQKSTGILTPKQIFGSNYLLDIDSRFVTVDSDGFVSEAFDQAQGNNAIATGAERPGYQVNSINGLPALTFDGAAQLLTSNTSVVGLAPGDTRTVYAVVILEPNAQPSTVFCNRTSSICAAFLATNNAPPYVIADGGSLGAGFLEQAGIPTTGVHLIEWVISYGSSGEFKLFLDGAQLGPQQDTNLTIHQETGTAGYTVAVDIGGIQFFKGALARLIQVKDEPNSDQESEMTAYFTAVYNIQNPWQPTELKNLVAFYSGDGILTQPLNFNVTQWLDRSPNALTAEPLAGAVVFPQQAQTGFNGQACITWSGPDNTVLQTPTMPVAGTKITIFLDGFWDAPAGINVLLESLFGSNPGYALFTGISSRGNLTPVVANDLAGGQATLDTTDGPDYQTPNSIVVVLDIGVATTGSTPRSTITTNGDPTPVTPSGVEPSSAFTDVLLNIGARVNGVTPSIGATMSIAALAIVEGEASLADIVNWNAWGIRKYTLPVYQIVADGDSITAGSAIGGTANAYPAQAGTVNGRTAMVANIAVGGDTSSGVITRLPTALAFANGFYPFIYSVDIGTNDLAGFPGTDLPGNFTALQSNLLTIWRTMRAGGALVIACTILPRNGIFENGSTQAQFNTDYQAMNVWIRSQLGIEYDKLSDFADSPDYGQVNQALLTPSYYQADLVHPNGTNEMVNNPTELLMANQFWIPALTAAINSWP